MLLQIYGNDRRQLCCAISCFAAAPMAMPEEKEITSCELSVWQKFVGFDVRNILVKIKEIYGNLLSIFISAKCENIKGYLLVADWWKGYMAYGYIDYFS